MKKKKSKRKKKEQLPVNPSLSHFSTVEEYMAYMAMERDTLPDTSTAIIPTSAQRPSSTPSVPYGNWCENFEPRPSSFPPVGTLVETTIQNFNLLEQYISSIPITKNNPPLYPSSMSIVKVAPMKDFLAWNIRFFHGGSLDLDFPLAQAIYVVPCTRAEYDNTTIFEEFTPLEPKLELYKRLDLAMLTSVLDHVSRPFVTSIETAPLPTVVAEYFRAHGQSRAQVIYGLLATLPLPLHRDTQAQIRTLMRSLCKWRGQVGRDGDEGNYLEVLLAVGVGMGVVGRKEVF